MRWLTKRAVDFIRRTGEDKRLARSIKNITGRTPQNLELYKMAIQHRSIAKQNDKGFRESNERLEYLGDAVLGMVVAEFLFKKYPLKTEGFLTEIRSRIVNRESLNMLAMKLGIQDIVLFSVNKKSRLAYKSIYGDTLEAIVGAVFMDRGYLFCKKFILKKLISHYDLTEVVKINPNYKSKIIEWAHQEGKEIKFNITEIKDGKYIKEFVAEITIEEKSIATGNGFSKKRAEQLAAQKSCELLEIE